MNPQFSRTLLDDGAPYSVTRIQELKILSLFLRTNWNGALEALPESLSGYSFWQYGSGNHASSSRRILGSIFICACLSEGSIIYIRHVIIEGSSQWVVGDGNYLNLSNNLRIPVEAVHMHPFLLSYFFISKRLRVIVLGLMSKKSLTRSTNMSVVMQN